MKKITLLTLSVAAASMGLSAQGKFDTSTAQLINTVETYQAAKANTRAGMEVRALTPKYGANDEISVIVTLADGVSADILTNAGGELIDARGDMAVVRLTPLEIIQISNLDEVLKISIPDDNHLMLEKARDITGVDILHSGAAELDGVKYDGTGVVCGMMDVGVDPNHINFCGADGTQRISRLWVITGSNSAITEYATPEKIKAFTTDDSRETHGTHVLGIMAGNSKDKCKIAYYDENGDAQISNKIPKANIYYGVATGAELAIGCGTLMGNNTVAAVGNILQYAESVGKPAVINLSLGNNVGPHDGSDSQTKYLSEAAKSSIVCVSAGNEGQYGLSIEKKFTASDKVIRTCVSSNASSNSKVDIWGSDASVLSTTFAAVDRTNGNVIYSYKLDKNMAGESVIITGDYYTAPGYIHDPKFNETFGAKGALFLTSNIDPANNRYNVMIDFQLMGSSTTIVPALIVEGQEGTTVNMYGVGVGGFEFRSNGIAGYMSGDPTNSINSLACGEHVIAVGAYSNRRRYPTLVGEWPYDYGVAVGAIAPFSSWGKAFGGRQLPDIVGPGLGIISSYSKYYIESGIDKDAAKYVVAEYDNKKRKSYWAEMSGTSMSSPFVAGVLATWAQADPTLTSDRVKQIFNETAIKDNYTAKQPERWGAGKIDAVAGLKAVLKGAGVADVAVGVDNILFNIVGDRAVEVFAAGAEGVTAELYTVNGMLVASAHTDSDTAVLDADNITPGVYIVRATTASGKTDSQKLVLK